jgi:beta-lactamase superfamily II metal-dependent hydrolase/methylphosphotriester-DNA--protein-cysteine methyltransferase
MKKYLGTLLPLFLLIFILAGGHSSLLRAMPAESAQPQPAAPLLSVYAIDIGQGDSLLIVSPTGKTVLIDTGNPGNEQIVTNALLKYSRDKRIDLFIASHPHADHIGSAAGIISASTVAKVLDSNYPYTTKTYENYLLAVQKSGTQFIQAAPDQTFDIGGGAKITVLAPIKPFFTKADLRAGATEPNANSVVVRLDYNKFSMLFTGDAEAETEARMISSNANLKAQVLKVGHHGSKYATSEAFLQAVHPEVAVISVGAANKYGHPTPEALARLKAAGVKVYRTDLQGEIKITSDGKNYQIGTQKTAPPADIFVGRVTAGDQVSGDSTESATPTRATQEATSKPQQPNAQQSNSSGQIIGNKNSKKYHLPGCPGYNSVSEKNRVPFQSAAEAEAAGYTLAGNCKKTDAKPTTSDVTIPSVPKTQAKPASEVEQTQQTKPAVTAPAAPASQAIGNKDSKIYHLPGCSGYDKVSEKNRVYFDSAEKAEAAGYRLAKNCSPGKQASSEAKPSTTAPTTTTGTPATGKPSSDAAGIASTPTVDAAQPPVVGNKNSKIYHLLGCPGYKTISEKNRVPFQSAAEAEVAGYKKAGNCNK